MIEPDVEQEIVVQSTIDQHRVHEEQQIFDPAGNHSRPDVTQLLVNRYGQSILIVKD